jgi:hypothetical protein
LSGICLSIKPQPHIGQVIAPTDDGITTLFQHPLQYKCRQRNDSFTFSKGKVHASHTNFGVGGGVGTAGAGAGAGAGVAITTVGGTGGPTGGKE